MSFSDKFRDLWDNKKSSDSSANKEAGSGKTSRHTPDFSTPSKSPPPLPNPSGDNASTEHPLKKENPNNESQIKSLDKEIQELRLNLEKIEMEAKNRREAH